MFNRLGGNMDNTFVHIPNFSKYTINQLGEVVNTVTKNKLNPTKINGYFVFPLIDDCGHKRFMRRSRLLCLTFKPIDNPENFQIDHIDCDKTHDTLSNLEWVTSQENSKRAGFNGLMGQDRPIVVRDYYTKNIKHYASLAEASRELNLSTAALKFRLQCKDGRVFPEGLQYKELSDKTDWEDKEDADAFLFLYGNLKRVYIRDLISGNVVEYRKLSDAATAMHMPLSTLSCYIEKSESKQPVLPGLVQLKFANDKRDWIDYDDPWIEMQKVTGRPLIQVKNPKTGVSHIFISQAECARQMHIKTTTLNNRLRMYNKNTIYNDGFMYGYYPLT